MSRSLFVYATGPIDNWTGWLEREAFTQTGGEKLFGFSPSYVDKILGERLAQAEAIARKAGWEGDYRQEPFFSAIPDNNNDSEILVPWKQDNNGTTFIASPYRLPWLDRDYEPVSA